MKKLLLILLMCIVQNTFSQNTKHNFKTKNAVIKTDSNINGDSILQLNLIDSGNSENAVYNTSSIDTQPEFPGGRMEFDKFIDSNFKIPDDIPNLKGKIYMVFIVEKDGSLSDIKTLKDLGFGTGLEAAKTLRKSPKWIPGENKGKKVRVLYSIPLTIN